MAEKLLGQRATKILLGGLVALLFYMLTMHVACQFVKS